MRRMAPYPTTWSQAGLLAVCVIALWAVIAAAGCAQRAEPGGSVAATPASSDAESKGGKSMTIQVTSTAFAQGRPIPARFTEDGEDLSPPLAFSGLPQGTRELALICDDPDAPRREPWVHWVIYKIPADCKGLPEGVSADPRPAKVPGARQGKNSWPKGQTIGYRGPAPPPGKTHHYHFTLYALDAAVDLEPGADKSSLLKAVKGHVLAQGRLTGTYRR